MDFAGLKLKITDAARSDIQQQVDALRASDKYFRLRLDLVLLYFPIIERVMKEENLPDDIKYLVIQESGLVSDAVSSANAVGFWMFKEPAGREVGLRIDKYVDERLNIVSSTRGACKYIKRHNFFFKNWVYSVIAHNTGRAGAEKHVNKSNFGADKMTIDKDTHWYFKTFLAHKIAFEGELKGKPTSGLELREYDKGAGKTLDKIAKDLKADESLVFQYNKWLKRGPVPDEKEYSVIIPVQRGDKVDLIARHEEKSTPTASDPVEAGGATDVGEPVELAEETYPEVKMEVDSRISSFVVDVNGIPAIVATAKDDLKSLAAKSGVEAEKLTKYNELKPNQQIAEGQLYYLKSKKSRAKIYYHTAEAGETLWDVSQDYGIKVKHLARKNRMLTIDALETGRVLWLRKKRPASVPVELKGAAPAYEPQIAATTPPSEQILPITDVETPTTGQIDPYEEEPFYEQPEIVAERQAEPEQKPEVKKDAPPAAAEEKRALDTHTVSKGETLYGIARRYGVTKDELQRWNKLTDNSILSIGQELQLIKRDTSNTKEVVNPSAQMVRRITVHVVAPGDTMYSISKKYSVSIEKLMKLNDKTNFVLSIGENLKVSD